MLRILSLLVVHCALLFALMPSIATAQEDGSVSPDYDLQYRRYYEAYLNDTADVAALLNLAMFYGAEGNPRHDYALAMKYSDKAATLYHNMVAEGGNHRKVTKLIRKGITVEVAQQVRENAVLAASKYIVAAKQMDEAELDNLSACCGNSPALQRLIRKKRTLLAYGEAQKEGTLAAYDAFARRFAGTEEADDSEVAMGLLADELMKRATTMREVDSLAEPYQDVKTVQRSALKRKSTLAYNGLLAEATPQELKNYLRRYPFSDHYMDVLDMLDQDLSLQLQALNKPQQLVDFIHNNEASPLSSLAMKKLRNMIVRDHNKEAARLYLKNFPLDEEFLNMYSVYYKWYSAEGNRNPVERFAKENPDSPFQCAIEADLRRGSQIDSLDLLAPYDEANYAKYISMVYVMGGKDVSYVAMLRTLQPFIATKNWNALVPRMAEFSPAFETYGMDKLQSLYNVIAAPTDERKWVASEASPSYHMTHTQITRNGAYLYYNRIDPGTSSRVHLAQYTKGKKSTWVSVGDIIFTNVSEGKWVTFYSLYDGDRHMLVGMDGDIWTAVKEGARTWRLEQRLPAPVNTSGVECDAVMLEDGSGILFCSDRDGGMNCQTSGAYFHGDTALATDIYFVAHSQDGWGKEAINLGGGVNSLYCERSPALSSDQKTLYFITDGRNGMGYGDIYYATREDARDWSHWNDAKNYGKEVNSGFNEASVSLNGNKLCFTSNRAGYYSVYGVAATEGSDGGACDISITCDQLARMQVVDPATHAVLTQSQHKGDTLRCRLYSGKHYLILPIDYDAFEAFVPSITYQPRRNGLLQLKSHYPIQEKDEEGKMNVANVKGLPLPALNFEPGTTSLTPQAIQQVDDLAKFLERNRNVRANLELFVDGDNEAACFTLGRRRCQLLQQQFQRRGVKATQISIANYGMLNRKKNEVLAEITLTLTIQ
ncbi:MAG: hypothetical protein SPJ13_01670 [Bacteroidales bacterium]|nr:hypothetical protein [Bacteroidales bacterium]